MDELAQPIKLTKIEAEVLRMKLKGYGRRTIREVLKVKDYGDFSDHAIKLCIEHLESRLFAMTMR